MHGAGASADASRLSHSARGSCRSDRSPGEPLSRQRAAGDGPGAARSETHTRADRRADSAAVTPSSGCDPAVGSRFFFRHGALVLERGSPEEASSDPQPEESARLRRSSAHRPSDRGSVSAREGVACPGDAVIRSSAATHAALPIADIEALERRVLEAGLFETDGRGLIRPLPDLVGDLILEETCLDELGKPTPFGQALLRSLLQPRHYQPVISNCSDVARLLSKPERLDFLSELVLERA